MMNAEEIPIWPSLNASLNALSAVSLFIGFIAIKRNSIKVHRILMSFAFFFSTVFLGCYLYYHFNYPPVRFQGQGLARLLYFSILISHIILAVLMLPFIINLMRHAINGRFDKHKKLAKWVWPVWMYTSITGILIYFMLYHWFKESEVILG